LTGIWTLAAAAVGTISIKTYATCGVCVAGK
jgi:hypothetical protein